MVKITKKKWLMIIIIAMLSLLIICNCLSFFIDPFFQYRYKDNQYMINAGYCAPGLIKTYDYDTIIIGSSMTQNFDMDLFRDELNCNPLHIGVGGMSDEDLIEYVKLANSVNKADVYYLCIDISGFSSESDTKTVEYLMKDDLLSKIQYSISYESLFRFMPIDMFFSVLSKIGYSFPESYRYRMKIDRFGYWGHQYQYDEESVINDWKVGVNAVSSVDTDDLYNKMIKGIDDFFAGLNLSDANYYFFFPPYSSLHWCNVQNGGYLECYLDAEEYFIEKANENGATVFYFQAAEQTTDLNNYKDTTHYSPKLNDWMTHCFSNNENIVTIENFSTYRTELLSNIETFYKKYSVEIEDQ